MGTSHLAASAMLATTAAIQKPKTNIRLRDAGYSQKQSMAA